MTTVLRLRATPLAALLVCLFLPDSSTVTSAAANDTPMTPGQQQKGEPPESPPADPGTAKEAAAPPPPKLGSGRPTLSVKKRKQAIRMITCDVCRLVVADFYDRGLEDEDAFDEYGNQVCDSRRQQGLDLWASVDVQRTDTDVWTPSGVNSMDASTDRGGGLRVKDMRPASQYCGEECLMVARACDDIISDHVGDLAERLLYGTKTTKETLVELVCGKDGWTHSCSKRMTTPPDGFRYDEDLPFVPLNEEERLYVEKITHYRWFQERTKAFGDGIRSLEEREDKMARELGGKHIAVGKSEEEATKQGQLWKKFQKKKKKKEKEEKKKKRRKEKEEAKKYRRAKKEMKKEERAKWKARQAKAENSPQDKKKTAAAAEL